MTEREREQCQALKAAVVDQGLALSEWDADFIRALDYRREQKRHKWLSDGQRRNLRRLLVKYIKELTAAGKRDLVFTEPPKVKAK